MLVLGSRLFLFWGGRLSIWEMALGWAEYRLPASDFGGVKRRHVVRSSTESEQIAPTFCGSGRRQISAECWIEVRPSALASVPPRGKFITSTIGLGDIDRSASIPGMPGVKGRRFPVRILPPDHPSACIDVRCSIRPCRYRSRPRQRSRLSSPRRVSCGANRLRISR